MLGAEPLHLLVAAASLGDAMERDLLSGTAQLCWFASIRVGNGFCLSWQCRELAVGFCLSWHYPSWPWRQENVVCVSFPGAVPVAFTPEPLQSQALHPAIGLVCLRPFMDGSWDREEKHPAPLPVLPTGPSPPKSLTDGERVFHFLKNACEYTHLCSAECYDGSCARQDSRVHPCMSGSSSSLTQSRAGTDGQHPASSASHLWAHREQFGSKMGAARLGRLCAALCMRLLKK